MPVAAQPAVVGRPVAGARIDHTADILRRRSRRVVEWADRHTIERGQVGHEIPPLVSRRRERGHRRSCFTPHLGVVPLREEQPLAFCCLQLQIPLTATARIAANSRSVPQGDANESPAPVGTECPARAAWRRHRVRARRRIAERLVDLADRRAAANGRQVWSIGSTPPPDHMTRRALSPAEEEPLAGNDVTRQVRLRSGRIGGTQPAAQRLYVLGGQRRKRWHATRGALPNHIAEIGLVSPPRRAVVDERWCPIAAAAFSTMTSGAVRLEDLARERIGAGLPRSGDRANQGDDCSNEDSGRHPGEQATPSRHFSCSLRRHW